jgi:hypothetical protein
LLGIALVRGTRTEQGKHENRSSLPAAAWHHLARQLGVSDLPSLSPLATHTLTPPRLRPPRPEGLIATGSWRQSLLPSRSLGTNRSAQPRQEDGRNEGSHRRPTCLVAMGRDGAVCECSLHTQPTLKILRIGQSYVPARLLCERNCGGGHICRDWLSVPVHNRGSMS